MSTLLTVPYFSSGQVDVMFEIWDVIENPEHPEHSNLQRDIATIDENDLEAYVNTFHINMMLNRFDNKELAKKVIYLTYVIHDEVSKEILKEISSNSRRQLPYSSPNLADCDIDEHQLISTSTFKWHHGILINNFGYELCPSTNASNSMYWAGQVLKKITKERGHRFRVRLHPFIEKPLSEYNPMMYLMTTHGKKLNWERLRNLKDDEYGQWMNDHQNGNTAYTDYVWSSKKNDELHFTCEEVPKPNTIDVRGSRYFHAIFDKSSCTIIHCDGAIRLYNQEQLIHRNKIHVKDVEAKTGHKKEAVISRRQTGIDNGRIYIVNAVLFCLEPGCS